MNKYPGLVCFTSEFCQIIHYKTIQCTQIMTRNRRGENTLQPILKVLDAVTTTTKEIKIRKRNLHTDISHTNIYM